MPITPLPTPPSRQDPTNFATRADEFLGQLPQFATEANALEAEYEAAATAAANAVLTSKLDNTNPSYTGTLTGGTGVVNIGSGQFVKDASGNVGVGTASPTTKFHAQGTGDITRVTNGTRSAYVAVDSAGFTLLTGAGQTGNGIYAKESDNSLQLWTNGSGKATVDASGNLTPGADNTQTNGSGATRWSTIYAGTGTINTSDAREKTAVRSMAADEIEAAKALSKEIGVYQFLDSVAVKGDKARHHVGMTVQRAIQIMEAHGLNPFAYGFICYDKWDEQVTEHPAIEARAAVDAKAAVLDAEGNVIEPAVEAQSAIEAKAAWTEVTLKAGDRYSFRYDQLALFIARGTHARLEALEAK